MQIARHNFPCLSFSSFDTSRRHWSRSSIITAPSAPRLCVRLLQTVVLRAENYLSELDEASGTFLAV